MQKRLKRLAGRSVLVPATLFVIGVLETIFRFGVFFEFVARLVRQHAVLQFMCSAGGLLLISTLWLTLIIFWPETRKRLPLWLLLGRHIRLRTWIDDSERHEVLYKRLWNCTSGEKVRFISFTGKSVLVPVEGEGKKLKRDYPFPRAVDLGVTFQGLLLDPESVEAKFRSAIEDTPETPEEDRLLQSDSREVANLPVRYKKGGIEEHVTRQRVRLKYISLGLPFSLWLFDDVALMEPYHVGRREETRNLCEFAQMIVPRSDIINYRLLEDHFQNLWEHAPSRRVFTEPALPAADAQAIKKAPQTDS